MNGHFGCFGFLLFSSFYPVLSLGEFILPGYGLLLFLAPEPVFIMGGCKHHNTRLSSFFISLSKNGSLNLRVLQLSIRNVISLSPFSFKTLIPQVNKKTGSNIEACDIWLVTHLWTKLLPYPLYLSQALSYHVKGS